MGVRLTDTVEEEVLEHLIRHRATIQQIADSTGRNYYTVRAVLKTLQDEGRVTPAGYHGRAVRYELVADTITNNSIPLLRDLSTDQRNKANRIIELAGQEHKMRSMQAVGSLVRNVTRIFMASIRINETGKTTENTQMLNAIHTEMTNDYQQLLNTVNLYKQILDNNRFWNVETVKHFSSDTTFNKADVIHAYDHYYPVGTGD